jgi:hypothetical protein
MTRRTWQRRKQMTAQQFLKLAVATILAATISCVASAVVTATTVNQLDVRTLGGYAVSHSPSARDFVVLEWPHIYHLSDGTSWLSGAGTYGYGTVGLINETVTAGIINYALELAPGQTYLMHYTDYDSGDHSSQGELAPYGPMVLTTPIGSQTAVMNGYAKVVSNSATWYGEPRFNFYSAQVGDAVPFTLTYSLLGSTWQPGIFDTGFTYNMTGTLDFTRPIPEPSSFGLLGITALALVGLALFRRCAYQQKPTEHDR